jgi:hypothetical protein
MGGVDHAQIMTWRTHAVSTLEHGVITASVPRQEGISGTANNLQRQSPAAQKEPSYDRKHDAAVSLGRPRGQDIARVTAPGHIPGMGGHVH